MLVSRAQHNTQSSSLVLCPEITQKIAQSSFL
jgi:hypothetical protein